MDTDNQSGGPQYGGHCAFAMSLGKKEVMGLEKHSLTKDGKVYLFSNPVAKFLFNILPNTNNKADANWISNG